MSKSVIRQKVDLDEKMAIIQDEKMEMRQLSLQEPTCLYIDFSGFYVNFPHMVGLQWSKPAYLYDLRTRSGGSMRPVFIFGCDSIL